MKPLLIAFCIQFCILAGAQQSFAFMNQQKVTIAHSAQEGGGWLLEPKTKNTPVLAMTNEVVFALGNLDQTKTYSCLVNCNADSGPAFLPIFHVFECKAE
jgi:hypothetical protein